MNPSINDRLSSVLRALETVILPALPASASLAQEQVMMAMGQLQIIQGTLDHVPAYEAEELADITAMGEAILAAGCPADAAQLLRAALGNPEGHPREQTEAIKSAIDVVLNAIKNDRDAHAVIASVILPLAEKRAMKDREWFKIMGFDIELSAG
ncbi:hypothetical protein ACFOWX_09170 [Sphingorhabdus arenilitoris]|uniref:Uncharacterized protein n=1 Tax=Sphingorhabdus arenilitoris TaxID=1490041 RepID=A0ABV8RI77_9SPHN